MPEMQDVRGEQARSRGASSAQLSLRFPGRGRGESLAQFRHFRNTAPAEAQNLGRTEFRAGDQRAQTISGSPPRNERGRNWGAGVAGGCKGSWQKTKLCESEETALPHLSTTTLSAYGPRREVVPRLFRPHSGSLSALYSAHSMCSPQSLHHPWASTAPIPWDPQISC